MSDLIRFLSLGAAFFAIAGLLIALGMFRGCSLSASESDIAMEIRDVPPAFNLADTQLVQIYLDNQEAAEAAYNGQAGIVRGALRGLREGANHLSFERHDVWSVRCFISSAEADNILEQWDSLRQTYVVSRVTKGLSVGGTGKTLLMKGRVEGVNNKHLSIDIRGCTLQDSP